MDDDSSVACCWLFHRATCCSHDPMTINNPPKLIGILLAMVLLTVVFGMGTLSESGYIGLMGLMIGYLVGNGVAARNHLPVEPTITNKNHERDY